MKKFLGFIALAVLMILPMKANAATWGVTYDSYQDADGYTVVTVKGFQSNGNTMSDPISATMELTNMEYIENSVVGNGVWSATVSGTEVTFIPSSPVTDSEFTIATMKFKKIDSAQTCKLVFKCNGVTKTVTPEKPSNPKTGSVLPYAVIVIGATLAGAVYFVTRRNAKFYKI